jgi:uncharacterized protein YegJ (DUF2314 family)
MQARILGFVVFLCCAAAANAQSIAERAARDEIIHMGKEEPAMRTAFDRASRTLADFLKRAAKPDTGTSEYALKVAISDGVRTEYFWVTNFGRDQARFHGILSNEPRVVKKYREGDRIVFARSQIVDWTYFDDVAQKTHGNFTACALLSKEPPEQVEAIKREHGLSCED